MLLVSIPSRLIPFFLCGMHTFRSDIGGMASTRVFWRLLDDRRVDVRGLSRAGYGSDVLGRLKLNAFMYGAPERLR